MDLVAGPPDAPAIVFVHGTRLTKAAWTPQLDGLADEFRTVAIDLPGHGHRSGEAFTLDGAVATVARAIDIEAGGRAVVVGLSLGGYVAMELAATCPERVRGLVLAGATADPTGLRRFPYLGLGWAMATFDGPRLDALNRWFFRTRFSPAIADPIIAGGFWSSAGADALRAIAGRSFPARLAAYPGRTLLLNGEFDLPFRLSMRAFARAAQDARAVRLAGATHLSNLDRPAAFNEAVRRFVRSLEGPGDAPGPALGAHVPDLAGPAPREPAVYCPDPPNPPD